MRGLCSVKLGSLNQQQQEETFVEVEPSDLYRENLRQQKRDIESAIVAALTAQVTQLLEMNNELTCHQEAWLTQTLLEGALVQKGEHAIYIKNAPKPTMWEIKDKKNIGAFFLEYRTYYEALGYFGDEVRVRSFGSFLKEGASTTFISWKDRHLRKGPITWQDLKDWVPTT